MNRVRRATQSSVTRAAAKAERAQNAKPIMAAIVGERDHDLEHCQWCGGPSPKKDGVCPGHRDLGGVQ